MTTHALLNQVIKLIIFHFTILKNINELKFIPDSYLMKKGQLKVSESSLFIPKIIM